MMYNTGKPWNSGTHHPLYLDWRFTQAKCSALWLYCCIFIKIRDLYCKRISDQLIRWKINGLPHQLNTNCQTIWTHAFLSLRTNLCSTYSAGNSAYLHSELQLMNYYTEIYMNWKDLPLIETLNYNIYIYIWQLTEIAVSQLDAQP